MKHLRGVRSVFNNLIGDLAGPGRGWDGMPDGGGEARSMTRDADTRPTPVSTLGRPSARRRAARASAPPYPSLQYAVKPPLRTFDFGELLDAQDRVFPLHDEVRGFEDHQPEQPTEWRLGFGTAGADDETSQL